jgi:hypothetical protein
MPFAPVYQVSRRRLVPSVANRGELFANAAKPGGELKLWDVTTGCEVSTLRRGIRPIGGLAYGAYAASGQEDGIGPGNKYFFLVGSFGAPAVRNNVTVPRGKILFFPLVNAEFDNLPFFTPGAPPPPSVVFTEPQLRVQAKAFIDSTDQSSLYATLDGAPLQFFRTPSPNFSYTFTNENISNHLGSAVPGGTTVKPAASDGYWCASPPLPPGMHTVTFGGAGNSPVFGKFDSASTYTLIVE